MKYYRSHVMVCVDPDCQAKGADAILARLRAEIAAHGLANEVQVLETAHIGDCANGPELVVYPDEVHYAGLRPEDIPFLVQEHLVKGRVVGRLLSTLKKQADEELGPPRPKEVRVVLRNCGKIDPESIEDYLSEDGYAALAKVLTALTPDGVIEEILASGLRGRGGAGFPTGRKWQFARASKGTPKYVICNADEGDPGAFMNRRVLEGDPHSVVEGMIIAAYAIGASQGYIYCRAEYPIAVQMLRIAIEQARQYGFLGQNIMGSDFSFDLEVRMGAGAFVCGEETALMASIEGRRGNPRTRPPFPAVSGLWGKPSNINNVETYANVPQIISRGAAWYASMGTEKSKGTKTFALAGDVNNTGLIEVPFGITLREIIYDVAGGIKNDRAFKAVQTGGPMGGCIPMSQLDLAIDYESLTAAGSIMGSGGMVVMDEDTCMVDIARFFIEFIQDESCGKCVPCRVGTAQMLEILERICRGEGVEGDIATLESLCAQIRKTSLCAVCGQGAPNPVESTLKHFRHEYEIHIREKRCPAGVCQHLVRASCVNACPAGVDSPAYIALVAQGKYREGLAVHRDANPFALVCGRVCPAFCEEKCRRGQLDQPIAIRLVKRFMADQHYGDPWSPEMEAEPNGKRVAVVGGGPAGLTAALRLTQLGYSVTVFEKMAQPGGMMAYGIPAYRLPREALFAEINHIRRAGVDIQCGKELGRDFSVDSLKADGYEAVVLALGSHKSQKLGIPGDDKDGVYPGIVFLRDICLNRAADVTRKRVVVVGGGDVAVDSARSALRLGASEVTIVYRREERDMPALKEEIEAAKEEHIPMHFLVNPVAILGHDKVTGVRLQRQAPGELDNSGRRRPKPVADSEYDIECDLVIPAIGQQTDLDWNEGQAVETQRNTTFKVGEAFETTCAGVFAAGDCVSGPATVIEAVAQAQKVALAVDHYLKTGKVEKVVYTPKRHTIAQCFNVADYAEATRPAPRCIPADWRASCGFSEVELGFEEAVAQAEAKRCLRCDLEWCATCGLEIPEPEYTETLQPVAA